MIGVLLQFPEESPFFEKSVMVKCGSWKEFEYKLNNQFDSRVYYMHLDSLDRDNHDCDARVYLEGSDYYYKVNNTVIEQII